MVRNRKKKERDSDIIKYINIGKIWKYMVNVKALRLDSFI